MPLGPNSISAFFKIYSYEKVKFIFSIYIYGNP